MEINERARKMAIKGQIRYVAYQRKQIVQCVAIQTADPAFTYFVMDGAKGTLLGQLSGAFTNKEDCVLFWYAANQQHFRDHGVFVTLGQSEPL